MTHRREFLRSAGAGFGMIALTALLAEDGLLAEEPSRASRDGDPLAPKLPHHAPRARRVIWRRSTPSPNCSACTASDCPTPSAW